MPTCEDYNLHVTALPNDRFNLNENMSLTRADMVRQLNDKLKHRSEKFVYLHAGRDLPWQDFIRMIDAVYVPNKSVVLVTERVQQESGGDCLVIPGLLPKGHSRQQELPIPDGLK